VIVRYAKICGPSNIDENLEGPPQHDLVVDLPTSHS